MWVECAVRMAVLSSLHLPPIWILRPPLANFWPIRASLFWLVQGIFLPINQVCEMKELSPLFCSSPLQLLYLAHNRFNILCNTMRFIHFHNAQKDKETRGQDVIRWPIFTENITRKQPVVVGGGDTELWCLSAHTNLNVMPVNMPWHVNWLHWRTERFHALKH